MGLKIKHSTQMRGYTPRKPEPKGYEVPHNA